MRDTDTTAPLFASSEAGHFTLPTELTAMRAGITALYAREPLEATSPTDEQAALIEATAAAAQAGKPLPDTAAIEDARKAERLAADRLEVTLAAAKLLTNRLTAAAAAAADTIITEHLQPKFHALLEEMTEAAAITARYADDPLSALSAPAKERKAFADLPRLYADMEALWGARRVLTACGARPALDTDGEFASVRNIDTIWPRNRRQLTARPWGNGLDGTLWLLRNHGEMWLPTPAEQDARYAEVYAEAEAQQTKSRQVAGALKSGYGPVPAYMNAEAS